MYLSCCFGPRYSFSSFSLFYPLTISFLSLGCKLCATNPTPYETTPTPVSNCLRGGSSSVSLGAGGATAAPWPHHPHYMPV
ncbi:hypothetical protein L208DRAFT_490873 [Tricholoma matsutake]|nr:hypothetical protein L208DRAFT_490873 [Tricholoma matsutake 945]